MGVINVSVAGARIELWEKDTYTSYLEKAPPWMKNIIKQYGDNPYNVWSRWRRSPRRTA